jgi:hypothetical protein
VDDLTGDVAIQGFVPAAIVSVACVCLMYRLLLQPQAASLESAALQQEVTALRELQIEVAATLQQQLKLIILLRAPVFHTRLTEKEESGKAGTNPGQKVKPF